MWNDLMLASAALSNHSNIVLTQIVLLGFSFGASRNPDIPLRFGQFKAAGRLFDLDVGKIHRRTQNHGLQRFIDRTSYCPDSSFMDSFCFEQQPIK
jgi:hypothetical protein